VGQVIEGRYRVLGVLGEGGMGVVYEGEHLQLGRRVAIKALVRRLADDPVAIARLRNEARLASALGHPNIVEVYDMGTLPDGAPYLVMERLEGETLAQRLRRERTLPIADAIEIVQQILSALAATHARGVLHRDLKPENVFLSRRPGLAPLARVLDFGISKQMDPVGDEGGHTLTRTGFVMGTPSYMAPEQVRGERALDGRVDLYAVGVIGYEMLLGRLPYTGRNPAMLAVEMLKSKPVRPRRLRPEIPPGLEAALLGLLAYAREERFASAGAALAAFTAFAGPAKGATSSEPDPTVVTGPPAGVRPRGRGEG
jgi:serine/threonine-protein kinase